MQPSVIDTHPQREKILNAILAGEPPKKIAAWVQPRINQTTIWRYRRDKVAPAMAKQASAVKILEDRGLLPKGESAEMSARAITDATRAALDADPIRTHVLDRQRERLEVLQEARANGDLKAWAAVDRNDISATDLLARLDGRLDSARPTASHVTLVVLPQLPGATQQPARIEAQDVEFRALPAGDPAKNPDAE